MYVSKSLVHLRIGAVRFFDLRLSRVGNFVENPLAVLYRKGVFILMSITGRSLISARKQALPKALPGTG